MSKTIVYIDGQNFMYSIAENLKNAGLISDKQEVSSIDIPLLLKTVLHVNTLDDTESDITEFQKLNNKKNMVNICWKNPLNLPITCASSKTA